MATSALSGRIDRLEVENFKSYKGNQVIGPFRNFTAIIGPNGAGKSNLMDAISFVLGVRSTHLRGSQLKDLIFAFNDAEKEKRGRRAHVILVYVTNTGEELQFMRTITTAGSSEYRINQRVVGWDEYNAKMKSLGILVKARNFLVFQGDLESIASKNPKELTVLFEQISGSEELKKDYELLEEQKARSEEKMAVNYQKRRAMAAERREKKEQKEEAEKHLELQEELKRVKTQYSLWQLFTTDKDVESADKELAQLKARLDELNKSLEAFAEQVNRKKQEQDMINKDVINCESKVARKISEIERRKPDVVKFKEELKRVHTSIEKTAEDLNVKRQQAQNQAKEVETFQRHLEDVSSQLQKLTQEGQEGGDKLELAESQMEEYRRIKEEAGTKTAKLRQDKENLDRLQKSDTETLTVVESDLQEVDGRAATLQSKLRAVHERYERSLKSLEDGKAELEQIKGEDQKTRERHRKSRQRADTLQAKLEDVEKRIKDLKADKRESERDIKLAENVASLKRLFSGVYGQISELCKPREKKYNLAVSIVLGKFFEAVVVDNEKTGKDSIEYLREQRQPPMTFIPLETVRVKPIQERLRTLGGSAKLLIDVIQYEKNHETAILYAVGNTLVCDTLDEAKLLAWGEGDRHKVITLDGTLLGKGGSLTGGISGNMEAKSRRWDNQALEALKNDRDRLQQELSEIPSHRDLRSDEDAVRTKISTLERRIAYEETETAMLLQKLEETQRELETIRRRKEAELPRLNQIKEAISSRAQTIDMLERRIHEIEDRIYRNFSQSVGVANIREYEENRLKQQEELAARRLQLGSTKDKLESQLKYELRRDMKRPVEQLERKMEEMVQQTVKLRDGAAELKRQQEAASKELDDLESQCSEFKAKAETVEAEIQAQKKESTTQVNRVGKLKRDITVVENHLESLKTKRNVVLENCELDQITLTTIEGDSVPMEIDSVGYVARTTTFDYSQLNRQYRQDMRPSEREKVEGRFKEQMETLSAEILRTVPNLKALGQYESLKEKEKESVEEFEAARKEAKELSDKFNAVKQDRYARFMEAFDHISTGIDQIYKELTMSGTHPLGGTAYLALENEDEPFLGGIRYTAMPPTKRFRDMEQLSGGEKTVAALALLFAIHSFRPSPFFVLDEVDAALDNLNVAKVAAYIHKKSRDAAMQQDSTGRAVGFQSVVISLKDQFYDKADSLVGVYRAADEECSKALTFDLLKYTDG